MNKILSSKSLVKKHAEAYWGARDAQDMGREIRNKVLGTFITVPELGANHIFTPEQLEGSANKVCEEAGWQKGSKEYTNFWKRIDAYRANLVEQLQLREEWKQSCGLAEVEATQRRIFEAENSLWRSIIERLKGGKDIAPILTYLAKEENILEIYRLRQALKAVAGTKAGSRR